MIVDPRGGHVGFTNSNAFSAAEVTALTLRAKYTLVVQPVDQPDGDGAAAGLSATAARSASAASGGR
jgi:hypothetical protein